MSNAKIDSLIQNGYEFKMGEYISQGFEIFKKNPGIFILGTLMLLAISGSVSYVNYSTNSKGISIINTLFQPVFIVGFYIIADKIRHNEPVQFGDYFKAFTTTYGKILGTSLLSGLLVILGLILLIIPGIYLSIGYSFAVLIVYFKNYSAWEAMEASRKLVGKQWFSFFVFFILIILINVLGIICLGVGLLVSLPVSILSLYAAFDDIVGVREVAAEPDLADHFIVS